MTLSRSHGRDACPINLWDLGSRTSAGNLVPHVTFCFASPETWPAVSCGLVAILARPGVSRARLRDQSLRKVGSQTATDGACFSATALLSGRDRPLRLCVLRRRGSEPETRRTGVWRPLPQASASSWRALASGVRPLSVTNRCRVHKSANARPRIRTFSFPTPCMARGPSVEHLPSRK